MAENDRNALPEMEGLNIADGTANPAAPCEPLPKFSIPGIQKMQNFDTEGTSRL